MFTAPVHTSKSATPNTPTKSTAVPAIAAPMQANMTRENNNGRQCFYVATRPATEIEMQSITASLCNTVSAQTITILKLKGRLRALSQGNQTLQAKNDGLGAENTQLKEDLAQTEKYLANTVRCNQTLQAMNGDLSSTNAKLQKELAELKGHLINAGRSNTPTRDRSTGSAPIINTPTKDASRRSTTASNASNRDGSVGSTLTSNTAIRNRNRNNTPPKKWFSLKNTSAVEENPAKRQKS